jgi:uncharacterized protein
MLVAMYVRRYLEDHVLRLTRSFPAVMVTGPRQVGKTTLLRYLAEQEDPPRRYVSLDEFGPRALAQEDPELFLQRYPPPVLIDEVQNAPALLQALKPALDRSGRMGEVWLTGSQHFPLMQRVSESLAGRVALVELSGLSHAEELGRPPAPQPFRPDRAVPAGPADRADPASRPGSPPAAPALPLLPLFERIVRGGFPRFVQPDPPPWETFYGSYLQTYIERDVRSLLDIADLAAFRRFLRLAAARTGQLLQLADLARDAGIAPSTASQWLSVLEATYQVYLLRPYFENISKRQIKTPKLYLRDTGLACYLTGWTSPEAAASGAMAGALLETYVIGELLKSYLHRGREAPLWFFRTKDGEEVDALLAEEGRLFPLEIKLSASPRPADLKGVRALARTGAALGHGALLCLTPEPFPLSAEVEALPVAAVE